METLTFRRATAADLPRIDAALRVLSESLGDTHRASAEDLARAGFGPAPAFHVLLAEMPEPETEPATPLPAGLALFSPLYSTSRGAAGVYVSDLWVNDHLRGRGLGPRLLAAVRDEAAALWGGAGFLRLGVYAHSTRARAFYDRLGFAPSPGETYLTVTGAALAALGRTA